MDGKILSNWKWSGKISGFPWGKTAKNTQNKRRRWLDGIFDWFDSSSDYSSSFKEDFLSSGKIWSYNSNIRQNLSTLRIYLGFLGKSSRGIGLNVGRNHFWTKSSSELNKKNPSNPIIHILLEIKCIFLWKINQKWINRIFTELSLYKEKSFYRVFGLWNRGKFWNLYIFRIKNSLQISVKK